MAAAEAIENEGFSQTLKDLFSGAVGGVAQVLIGESLVLSPSNKLPRKVITCLVRYSQEVSFYSA